MTAELLFRDDAYLQSCTANVMAVNERGGVILDRTVFYPTGGGQPGDIGRLTWAQGAATVTTTVKGERPDEIVHVLAEGENAAGTRSASRSAYRLASSSLLDADAYMFAYPLRGRAFSGDRGPGRRAKRASRLQYTRGRESIKRLLGPLSTG